MGWRPVNAPTWRPRSAFLVGGQPVTARAATPTLLLVQGMRCSKCGGPLTGGGTYTAHNNALVAAASKSPTYTVHLPPRCERCIEARRAARWRLVGRVLVWGTVVTVVATVAVWLAGAIMGFPPTDSDATPVPGRSDLGRCPVGVDVDNAAGNFLADLTVRPRRVDCVRAAAPVAAFLDPRGRYTERRRARVHGWRCRTTDRKPVLETRRGRCDRGGSRVRFRLHLTYSAP